MIMLGPNPVRSSGKGTSLYSVSAVPAPGDTQSMTSRPIVTVLKRSHNFSFPLGRIIPFHSTGLEGKTSLMCASKGPKSGSEAEEHKLPSGELGGLVPFLLLRAFKTARDFWGLPFEHQLRALCSPHTAPTLAANVKERAKVGEGPPQRKPRAPGWALLLTPLKAVNGKREPCSSSGWPCVLPSSHQHRVGWMSYHFHSRAPASGDREL